MKAVLFIVVLMVTNFLYQYVFQDVPNWYVAWERSYFQAIAISAYWLFNKGTQYE